MWRKDREGEVILKSGSIGVSGNLFKMYAMLIVCDAHERVSVSLALVDQMKIMLRDSLGGV